MAVAPLFFVISAGTLVAVLLLLAMCMNCRKTGPPASIRQASVGEDYIPSTEFRVALPAQPIQHVTSNSSSNHLSPHLNSVHSSAPSPWRQPSFTATETESNPSYENPGIESAESDAEDTRYIIVLPEGQDPTANQSSRASTPDVQNDYVNVDGSLENQEIPDYLNVESLLSNKATSETSSWSEDEGNYVNQ